MPNALALLATAPVRAAGSEVAGAQFPCFTSTKVHTLTPEELRAVGLLHKLLRVHLLY